MEKFTCFIVLSLIPLIACSQDITPNCQGNYSIFMDGAKLPESHNTEARAMAAMISLQAKNPASVVVYIAGDVGAPRTCGVDIPQSYYDAVIAAQNPPPPPPNTPPVVTLTGGPVSLEVGEPYVDPGFSCNDAEDGPIAVVPTDPFPVPVVAGNYQIDYVCTDSGALTDSKQRTVTYTDPPPPPPPSSLSYRGIPDVNAHFGFNIDGTYTPDLVLTGSLGHWDEGCRFGTAQDPYVIDATNATFHKVEICGENVIWIGGVINANPGTGGFFRFADGSSNCEFCVGRDFELIGTGTGTVHSSATTMRPNTALLRAHIHDFGDDDVNAPQNDFHAVKSSAGCAGDPACGIWILDCEFSHNGGDGFQIGHTSGPIATNVYIGGGHMHHNRENCGDMKRVDNVVISGVTCSNHPSAESDGGESIVCHSGAKNCKIYDSIINEANGGAPKGIVFNGDSGHEADGNTVITDSVGIECRGTDNYTITNNTITAPTGLDIQSGCNGTEAGNVVN